MALTSRRQVAVYLAGQLPSKRKAALRLAAAWLMRAGRADEATYLAQDVAAVLAECGYLPVTVTTARALSVKGRAAITASLQRKLDVATIELNERVDPAVIGGLMLTTPTAKLDATVRGRLARLVHEVAL